MSGKKFSYGGQAVLEGVMMRGLRQATVAVRTSSGQIVFKHEQLNVKRRHMWEHMPFLRGILMLWDALSLGIRALNFSAAVAMEEEEQQPSQLATTLSLVVSLLFVVGLFFILPAFLASLAEQYGATPVQREFIQGLIRLLLFLGYIIAISQLPDIQRVFGYHGAEHKTINAYEAGASLTVASVRRFTLIHPRCGTSFLLVVFIVSFGVFLFVRDLSFWERLLSHIPLIPIIAGVTYELLRLSAAHYHRRWVRRLVAPSLALQRLTTREPDDQMIAVAIAALLPVLAIDGAMPEEYDPALAGGLSAATGNVALA